jgi:RecJ-like exonuclease
VDGLVCASLVKMAKNAEITLADYSTLDSELGKIDRNNTDQLYLCDMSLGDYLIPSLNRVGRETALVYLDHHPMKDSMRYILEDLNCTIVHSTEKCAGILTLQYLKEYLPESCAILAAYASVSDYPHSSPEVSKFVDSFDTKLLAFETSLLYYSVAHAYNDNAFKLRLVDCLSKGQYPHQIDGVMDYTQKQVDYTLDLINNADSRMSYGRHISHVEVHGSIAILANSLVQIARNPTTICYCKTANGAGYNLSIRSRERHNLGEMADHVARLVGGTGGGHPMAAGAQLPAGKLALFLQYFDEELDKA